MAKAAESDLSVMSQWVKAKLAAHPFEKQMRCPMLKVARQDFIYSPCTLRRSLANSPMTIGKKTYTRGVATHAESIIEVTLPSAGDFFKAEIGRDQNQTVVESAGNIQFVVEVGGEEVFRSEAIHGGESPIPISIPLNGAGDFVLRVTGDYYWGHANWANAQVLLKDGQSLWLDDLPFSGAFPELSGKPPFSFVYDGKSSRQLLDGVAPRVLTERLDDSRCKQILIYVLPETTLEVRCEAIVYKDYPAAEWVVYFKNNGEIDTSIIQDIRALDMVVNHADGEGELVLNYALGSNNTAEDFAPKKITLDPNFDKTFAADNGRPSSRSPDGVMPFFNIQGNGGGIIAAIGWTGQWSADFKRNGGKSLAVQAGMELTRLKLHPGEEIRTPRILLLFWRGDWLHGQNMFRSFILDHCTPRPGGKLLQAPIAQLSFGTVPAKEHLRRIEVLKDVPFEYYWIDAGWYGDCKVTQQWYSQVGSWKVNPTLYPDGLKLISRAAKKAGRKLIVWFEPERVYKGSELYNEHPGWLLGKDATWRQGLGLENWQENSLLDLGNPQARRWITDRISQIIDQEGIDLYRQDFNIDPLKYWRNNDEPDREGITEIRYVEGLYAFWDELLRCHPNLIIDNCSSGGRRIDIEMARRSIPLWQSDLQCSPYYSPLGSQAQTLALSYWLPLHSCGCREAGDTYDFRSALSSNIIACWVGIEDPNFPVEWAKRMVDQAIAVRKFFYGDIYPITEYSLSEEVWLAYQLDRDDLGEGVIMAYRRAKCPYASAELKLHGLLNDMEYSIQNWDTGEENTCTGQLLMEKGLTVTFTGSPDSTIIGYKKRTHPSKIFLEPEPS
ncbi:MAG: alpha-galactosidase [Victivallales bacterium]